MNIYPSYIENNNFKYIVVDGKYISVIVVTDYPEELDFLYEYIPQNTELEIATYISKQDTNKILKEITYNISSSKAEIKTVNNNQVDIDVISRLNSDAKKLRYEIQINGEEIYYVYKYICIKSDKLDTHIYNVKSCINKLYSKRISSHMLNFRHLDGYLATLPLNMLKETNIDNYYKNMTTTNISFMFPFVTNAVNDVNGTLFGYTPSNKVCSIDLFNDKYLNSNICIFGSSGSGKSYFTKLIILRRYIKSIRQYIFDPEGEYTSILDFIGGVSIDIAKDKINLMDITKEDIETNKEEFLEVKSNEIYNNLCLITDFEKCNKSYFLECIKESYKLKGINSNLQSMYLNDKLYLNKVLKDSSYMPILEDIYLYMTNDSKSKTKAIKNDIKALESIIRKYSLFNGKTNKSIYGELLSFDFSKISNDTSSIYIKIILNKIINILKFDKVKTVIYIDEIWKFIYKDDGLSLEIFNLFKTIRKLNSGIVSITQDISDFFYKDLGNYGKSILNNSCVKIFFKMEYNDKEMLNKMGILSENNVNSISKLNKGNMFMIFSSNNVILNIKASKHENKIIESTIRMEESYDNSSGR